jgi:hypothetical protein
VASDHTISDQRQVTQSESDQTLRAMTGRDIPATCVLPHGGHMRMPGQRNRASIYLVAETLLLGARTDRTDPLSTSSGMWPPL